MAVPLIEQRRANIEAEIDAALLAAGIALPKESEGYQELKTVVLEQLVHHPDPDETGWIADFAKQHQK